MDLRQLIYGSLIPESVLNEMTAVAAYLEKHHGELTQYFYDTPELLQEDYGYQTREMGKRFVALSKLLKDKPELQVNQHVFTETSTFYLNWNAFLSTVSMLGTPEQVKHWQEQTLQLRLIGGYAQTEVGHGSNVQGLQTTAVFDPKDDTFVLNTPSYSSYKLWPGLLGQFGTHMILQAYTTSNGKSLGIQTFVVPIRKSTYEPFSGVDVGDQGMKLGFMRPDNGYLGLKDYKVPRSYLLQRYMKVDRDGGFQEASKDAIKFGYGSMLNLRVFLVNSFSWTGLSASCLAYTQTKSLGSLDVLRLARSFSVHFSTVLANRSVQKIFKQYQHLLVNHDPKTSQTLNDVHMYSSALKPLSGWEAIRSVREALQISPVGYLNASKLVAIYGDSVPYATYEGDNNVLLQQSARYIIKQISELSQGKQAKGVTAYFNKHVNATDRVKVTAASQLCLNTFETLFERLALETAKDCSAAILAYMQEGHSLNKVWNELHQSRINSMVMTFTYVNVFRLAKAELATIDLNPSTKELAGNLLNLYGLFLLLDFGQPLHYYGILEIDDKLVHAAINSRTQNHRDSFDQITVGMKRPINQHFTGYEPRQGDFDRFVAKHLNSRL